MTHHGIAYQPRGYGDGVLVVVVGVTPDQGAWESHVQGEGAQVESMDQGKGT